MRSPTGGTGAGSIRLSGGMMGLSSSALCALRAAVRVVVCSSGVIKLDSNGKFLTLSDTLHIGKGFNKHIQGEIKSI